MPAVSFHLSVSYINLPVNPSDLSDPSTAAAPGDGGRDKDARGEVTEEEESERERRGFVPHEVNADEGRVEQHLASDAPAAACAVSLSSCEICSLVTRAIRPDSPDGVSAAVSFHAQGADARKNAKISN